MEFDDFNLDLYEDVNYSDNGDATPYSSIFGTNSSSSIVCATLTNFTEDCQVCDSGKATIFCK